MSHFNDHALERNLLLLTQVLKRNDDGIFIFFCRPGVAFNCFVIDLRRKN
jgi:hypothetical protein